MNESITMKRQSSDETPPLSAGTVSPKDLMDLSAPPSASFTDLSTPSDLFSCDPSPMFLTDMELVSGNEQWDSLFPTVNDDLGRDSISASCNVDVPKNADFAAPLGPYSPLSSVNNIPPPYPVVASPSSRAASTKPSDSVGIRQRKSKKPLPVIDYDSSDPVAAKRARNTAAARKSRARKVEAQEGMQQKINELEKLVKEQREEIEYLKSIVQDRSQ